MFIAIRLSKEISSVGATCCPSGAGFELHAWNYKHCVPTGLPESPGNRYGFFSTSTGFGVSSL